MARLSRRPPRSPAPPRRAPFFVSWPRGCRAPAFMSGLPYRPMLPLRMLVPCRSQGPPPWPEGLRGPGPARHSFARAAGIRECQGEAAHPMRRTRDDRAGRMRPRAIALFAAATLSAMPAAVRAEGPLYLRIRPNPVPAAAAGSGAGQGRDVGRESSRESVWERADRRARIAIASVCTGCLDPRLPARPVEAPVPLVRASRPPDAALAAAEDVIPSSNPSPAGDP